MERAKEHAAERLLFLDNVRYLMVLLVVVFHVSAGYSGLSEFYIESASGGGFLVLRNILSSLPSMQLLFFVAGYFTLPSLGSRGYSRFLWRKFERLGIPLILCSLFLGPLMPYLGYYSQSFKGLESASYWEFWTTFVKSGFSDWLTFASFTTSPQFHLMHYWFLSILLQFFAFFALGHAIWKKGLSKIVAFRPQTGRSVSITNELILAALIMAGWRILGSQFDLPRGNFALFVYQPFANIFFYGGFFALGIYAQARGWFLDGRTPGLPTVGVLGGMLIALAVVSSLISRFADEMALEWFFTLSGNLSGILFDLCFLAIVTGLTSRYMNHPSTLNARLAANSYVIYLIHYPLILIFRLVLLPWEGAALFKFSIVLALALFASYALSNYLIRPFTRSSFVGLIGLNVLLFAFGMPRSSYSHLLLDRRAELHAVIVAEPPERVEDPRPELPQRGWRRSRGLPNPLRRWRGRPRASLSWAEGRLYFAFSMGGLHARLPDGTTATLAAELELTDIAPLPGGRLAAVEAEGGRIVELDRAGTLVQALVDSAELGGPVQRLVSDDRGAIYFTSEAADEQTGRVWRRSASGELRLVLEDTAVRQPNGLALSADGRTLFVNDRETVHLWALELSVDGSLVDLFRFGELFRGDARYGRPRTRPASCEAEGMVADREGRLYVGTQLGVQVFDAGGRLLGIVEFPVSGWRPRNPSSVVFGGEELSILYVACGDQVYVVRTQTAGIP